MENRLGRIDYSKIRRYAKKVSVATAVVAMAYAGSRYAVRFFHDKSVREEIAKDAAVMGDCPIKGQETKGCLDDDKKANLLDSAKKLEGAGDFRGAGLIYIRLGDDVRATEMAVLCEKTGKEGAAEIKERIMIRAEAIKQYVDAPPPAPKTGPSSSASGAPSAQSSK